MSRKKIPKQFQPREGAREIIRSATRAIECIWHMGRFVLKRHRKYLIDCMLWKITEAHGKWNTRYCSYQALKGGELRHDHVETRKRLVDRILKVDEPLESILKDAIACVVTSEEHRRLSLIDKSVTGWERYAKAQIRVFDRLKCKELAMRLNQNPKSRPRVA